MRIEIKLGYKSVKDISLIFVYTLFKQYFTHGQLYGKVYERRHGGQQ